MLRDSSLILQSELYDENRELARGWADLPLDLMHLVMRKIEEDTGIAGAVPLRQVSKSWFSAFQQFPAEGGGGVGVPGEHLHSVCSMLPLLKILRITLPAEAQPLDFGALAHCSELSCMHIDGDTSDYEITCLDLEGLLGNAHSVTFFSVTFAPLVDLHSEWSNIEKLALMNVNSSIEDITQMMQCLPNLKVRLQVSKIQAANSELGIPF